MPRKRKPCSSPTEVTPHSLEPEITVCRVDQLHPHPLQDRMFSRLTPQEFEELVQDIARRGMDHEPDVLPANVAGLPPMTIVMGHQRVLAAQALGWKTLKVRIRHDLADKPAEVIEEALIRDNLIRRQLSRLEQARCMLRLFEIELGRAPGDLCAHEELEARQRVAQRFSCSEKTVARNLDVLKTPTEVQAAYDRGLLKIEHAVQVSHLALNLQQEIAEQIRAGANPKTVVTPYLRKKALRNSRSSPLSKAAQLLQQALQLLPMDIDTIAAECPGGVASELLSTLDDLQRLAPKLSSALSHAKKRSDDTVQQMLSELRADC